MSRLGLRLGQVLAVLIAMALGHLVTSHLSIGGSSAAPFVRTASPGRTAHLEYADVSVDDVRGAATLGPPGSDSLAVKPGGVWVVVTAALRATREPTRFLTVVLTDAADRVYRGSATSTCPLVASSDTGITTHAMFCFDVPADGVRGLHLRVARGDEDQDDLRRDDVADLDLGIDATKAAEIVHATANYRVQQPSTAPIVPETITLDPAGS